MEQGLVTQHIVFSFWTLADKVHDQSRRGVDLTLLNRIVIIVVSDATVSYLRKITPASFLADPAGA